VAIRTVAKDLFTCRTSRQGSRNDSENVPSLTRLIHLPGKLAGVGCFISLDGYLRQLLICRS